MSFYEEYMFITVTVFNIEINTECTFYQQSIHMIWTFSFDFLCFEI